MQLFYRRNRQTKGFYFDFALNYSFSFIYQVDTLFNSYKNAGINQGNKAKLIETIDENIKWLKKYKDTIGNWLEKLPKLY